MTIVRTCVKILNSYSMFCVIIYIVSTVGYDRVGHRNSYDDSFPPPPTFKQGYNHYNSFDGGQGGYQRDSGSHRNNCYVPW